MDQVIDTCRSSRYYAVSISARRPAASYFSSPSKRRDKDEMIDMARGSRYKISVMRRRRLRDEDVARCGPRTRELLEYHLDGSRFSLNCATRLNLHYPIVGTAPPFSARSHADRCA